MVINKYKKYHKKKNINQNEKSNLSQIKIGFYGLKSLEFGVITPKEIETARRIIARVTKRSGKIKITLNFNRSLTKKPLLSRMGKGTGPINSRITYIKKGKILIEVNGISKKLIFFALNSVRSRISIKTHIVKRNIIDIA